MPPETEEKGSASAEADSAINVFLSLLPTPDASSQWKLRRRREFSDWLVRIA